MNFQEPEKTIATVKSIEQGFKQKYGDMGQFDQLYLPQTEQTVVRKVTKSEDGMPSIQLKKVTKKYNVEGILKDDILKSSPLNAISFIRYRNFGLTELELTNILDVLGQKDEEFTGALVT